MDTTIISYIPLYEESKRVQNKAASVYYAERQDEIQKGNDLSLAMGVLWAKDPTAVYLVVNNKDAVFDHMVRWAEDKPEEWFTLDIVSRDSGYFVCIHPILEMSFKRSLASIKDMPYDEAQELLDNGDFIFCPIRYGADSNIPIHISACHTDGKTVTVGLVDIEDARTDQYSDNLSVLGNLKVRYNNSDTLKLLQGEENE